MKVSDVLLRVLSAYGLKHLFGLPGDAINDVMDAVCRQDESESMTTCFLSAPPFARAKVREEKGV